MHLLIVTFYEIVIKCGLELKTQLLLFDNSTNHNVGLPRALHFNFCQMIYLNPINFGAPLIFVQHECAKINSTRKGYFSRIWVREN